MGTVRRERGTGSVYEDRSRGGWVAELHAAGRRHRARAGSKSEADAALARLQERWAPERDAAELTVDAWLRSWLAQVRHTVRASTLTSYTGHVERHISPLIGGIRLRELRPADVRRLQAELLAKRTGRGKGEREDGTAVILSPNTAARVLTTLRIALAAAVREELVPSNAAAMTGRLPRAELPPVEPMTPDMLARYITAGWPDWLGPLVRLLAGSGLRLGEALSLDQGDVSPDDAWVRIRRSKTTIRAVPVSPDAAAALRSALAACPVVGPREPLFWSPRRDNRNRGHRVRLSGWSVTHALPEQCALLGLPRITPHKLRHGAATVMVARGAHMRVVAAQLGHANPALTARVYAHVVPQSQRDAAGLLEVREGS